jgi:DNA-binding protein H-NS
LAGQNDEDSLSAELESRLDDLFGEDDKFSEGPVTDEAPADYPLGELKNLVLSIDWEITDEVLKSFIRQVNDLKATFKEDKINLTFLQILGSLGEYIKTNRGKAHPKTFKILNSVFSRFDDVVLSKDMQENEKKRILRDEMNKYKVLREQISHDKTAKARKKAAKTARPIKLKQQEKQSDAAVSRTPKVEKPVKASGEVLPDREKSDVSYSDEIGRAVEEIKKFVRAEFKMLREELNFTKKQT